MRFPEDLRYTTTHEWVRPEGDRVVIGITDYAQHELGDVIYLELPEVGRNLSAGEMFGTVESVKAVSDLYAPLSGEVVDVNAELPNRPEAVNQSPYDRGWMIALRPADPSELERLLDSAAYVAQLPAA
jgi:glycine cleavage system H protein